MELLDDVKLVRSHCENFLSLDFVALDTEFMRTDTYYAELSLVQIRAGDELILVDPMIDGMAEALSELLTNRDVVKVLHAGSEDLQILSQYCGQPVGPIFDTQIAAAFCNYGFSLSYGKLVALLCGVELDKGETRSDWKVRPLSEKQIKYAADDVIYLPEIYRSMVDSLNAKQRLAWVVDECEQLELTGASEVVPEQAYLKIGRAWQLSPRKLLALQLMASWREKTAIERNRPRSWILKDKALWDIADQLPKSNEDLARVEGIAPGQLRRISSVICELLGNAREAPESELPEALPQPTGRAYSKVSKKLRATVNSIAEKLQVAPEMLARKKDIEYMLLTHSLHGEGQLSPSLSGWRADVVGNVLLNDLNNFFSDTQAGAH